MITVPLGNSQIAGFRNSFQQSLKVSDWKKKKKKMRLVQYSACFIIISVTFRILCTASAPKPNVYASNGSFPGAQAFLYCLLYQAKALALLQNSISPSLTHSFSFCFYGHISQRGSALHNILPRCTECSYSQKRLSFFLTHVWDTSKAKRSNNVDRCNDFFSIRFLSFMELKLRDLSSSSSFFSLGSEGTTCASNEGNITLFPC